MKKGKQGLIKRRFTRIKKNFSCRRAVDKRRCLLPSRRKGNREWKEAGLREL